MLHAGEWLGTCAMANYKSWHVMQNDKTLYNGDVIVVIIIFVHMAYNGF